MRTAVLLLLLIVVPTAAASLGVFYWQFASWPAYLWRRRVERLADELRDRLRQLAVTDPDGTDARAGRAAAELFAEHLRSRPVEQLIGRPGIGPGTADRVRNAGGRTLADLTDFRFEDVPGIGPAKGNDLRAAVRAAVRDARSAFDAGGCPEGQEYQRRLAAMRAEEASLAAARDRERAAVEAAERAVAALAELARDVTFQNFLFHREVPGLTDELLDRPLPAVVVPSPAAPPAPARVVPVAPPVPVAVRAAKPATTAAGLGVPPAPPPPVPQAVDPFAASARSPEAADDPPRAEHPWLAKLHAYARFGMVIAKADGRVARAELRVVRAFLDEKFGHDPVLVRHIDPVLERTGEDVPPEAEAVDGVKHIAADAERRDLYALAERIADASGERNQREKDALARLAVAFGATPSSSAPPPAPEPSAPSSPAPPADPRAVLGIEPGAELSPELVRRRYNALTDKFDPAKAAALGPEFARMAADKRAAVRAAAAALIAPFGVPLDPPAAPPPPADPRHNPDLDDAFGA